MKDLPVVFKVILNIFLFIFYCVIAGVVLGIIHGAVISALWKSFPAPNDPIYTQMFIFATLFVFIVSIVLRRYFYINCSSKSETISVKQTSTKKDDGLKIQIEKEIK